MAKQAQRELLTPIDRLAIRISNMINSPQAQHRRSALIHRLDTDPEEVWDELVGLLVDTDGLTVVFQDDGDVLVSWEKQEENESAEAAEDLAEEAEAPF
ncbi:DUF1654 domain-containing protein [Pseudomonas sp. 21LCFQ010]|uniref:DUF1654 domain-containing protein n=1 Tax=Pseudomonas sp. 21LCFQ010 TaxID=2957506 RepID=UPI0020978943|nr:DUF1654 domain-containing protein [Pseudomonas sp. 21LCFQ010]MCO8161043.1 DUF1654 domain-containing protein [Pseudomonas sp. 21LCFQ010]